jgi:hypothetical protein
LPLWKPSQLTVQDSQQTLSSGWQIQPISSRKTWEVWFAETKTIRKIRVSYASLELLCMNEAIQWESNKDKLHCVDDLAALLHTTAYHVPGLYLHSWVQTPARWLVQWGHLMTSVSSWDRTRRCPFDATAYTTAPAHLARQGGLAAFMKLERRFTWSRLPAIPLLCHIRMPHQNSTMKLRKKATNAKNRPPPTSLPRTPRSSCCVRFVAAASKACDAKPAVSERASQLTFWAS